MADIDEILVCPECLHPVDKLVLCPDCDKPVKKVPSLLLPTLRILRAKGWIVEEWDGNKERNVSILREVGSWDNKERNAPMASVEISFYKFSPPLPHSSMRILPSLKNSYPTVTLESSSETNAWIELYHWAKDAPCFAIPFAQDICDMCRGQAISWFFSECVCASGRGIHHRHAFADGIPEECIYADAQVVTMENRFNQLEKFFEKNPITRRKAARQLPRQL